MRKMHISIVAIFLTFMMVAMDFGLSVISAEARSKGGASAGRGSSWSGPTRDTWNRSGGGLFGGKSSSGYSKPSVREIPSSSGYSRPSLGGPSTGTYSKPSLRDSVGGAQDRPALGGGGSGYSKPSLGQSDYFRSRPPSESSPGGSASPSGSGYSKPSLRDSDSGSGVSSQQRPFLFPGGQGYSRTSPDGGSRGSGGYSKPSAGAIDRNRVPAASSYDTQAINQQRKQRAQESLQQYKSEQARFKNPEPQINQNLDNNPLYQRSRVYSNFDYGNYYSNRDGFFRNQGYQPPGFAYNSSPGFGLFNTLFLFWMLDHMNDKNVAAMAYHHKDDPGFKKWREEADKQAKDNAELKAKLEQMDKQVKALEGTPKDPSYLPPGVPPEAALSATALAQKKPEKPVLRVATGNPGGWYQKYGEMLKNKADSIDVQLIPSGGSLDNLRMLAENKADMAIVQSDVLAFMQPGDKVVTEQTTLYAEYAQLIANRNSGIKSLKDIDPRKNVVFIGPKGSGTALTWQGLAEQNEFYKKIPVRYADYSEALAEVEKNPKALMMFVGGLSSDILKMAEQHAEKSGKLRLIEFDDKKLLSKADQHGNQIYKLAEIKSNIYPELQRGWFFSGSVDTLAVQAVLVLRTDWAKTYGAESMDALSVAVLQTKPEIQQLANK